MMVAAARADWVWQGALSPTSVRFKIATNTKPSLAAQDVERRPHFARITGPPVHGVYDLVFENLAPNTQYAWAWNESDGSFTTPPAARTPFNFSFAFASCADNDSSHPIFKAIADVEPLVFLHIGDLHYGNLAVNDVAEFMRMYERSLAHGQRHLYHRVPVVYMMDDHDYGPNNADSSSLSRAAALEAYRAAVPAYATARNHLYQSFTIGRVLFIVTDTSSERVAGSTVLGPVQLAWMLKLLEQAGSDPGTGMVVWATTMPWIDDYFKWGEFPDERLLIAQAIERAGLTKKMIIVSGDAHMVAVDDGSHSAGGVPVFQAAAMDAKPTAKGGPYSHGIFPGRNQFGQVSIKDYVDVVCATFFGWRWVAEAAPLKRLVYFDTCHPEWSPRAVYYPSPLAIQKTWKAVKKTLEPPDSTLHAVLWPVVVAIDSSALSFWSVDVWLWATGSWFSVLAMWFGVL